VVWTCNLLAYIKYEDGNFIKGKSEEIVNIENQEDQEDQESEEYQE
jgi:hypothetical protein